MSDPVKKKTAREILKSHELFARKRFGQNFLVDEDVLDDITEASMVTKDDFALEIGPGLGVLTRRLSEAAREVTAVEIDTELIPVLEETLSGCTNVTVLNQDILKTDLKALIRERNGGNPIAVVANLPYYITTPILMKLLTTGLPIRNVTVMIQKEVAGRMIAGPGSREYGALSLAVNYYTEPEIVRTVPPSSFYPRPKVESAVIRLMKREKPPVAVEDENLLFRLIRCSFNHRRKTLVNGLLTENKGLWTREQVLSFLEEAGLPPMVRGESLSLEDFARLTNVIGYF